MRPTASALLALALAALPQSAPAQSPPTECASPPTAIAAALCADPDLRALDQAVARAFAAARGRIDRDSRAALDKDQKVFLEERGLIVEKRLMPLRDYLSQRLAFLESLQSPKWGRDAAAYLGVWRNSLGEVRVTPGEGGRLTIAVSTLSPAETTWICDIEAEAEPPRNGVVTFTEDEVKVTLSRRGSALVVGDRVPEGDGGRPFCGANGYIDGTFFRVQ